MKPQLHNAIISLAPARRRWDDYDEELEGRRGEAFYGREQFRIFADRIGREYLLASDSVTRARELVPVRGALRRLILSRQQ